MSEKMTKEKAEKIVADKNVLNNVNCPDPHCQLVQNYGTAKGFLEGWDARMEFEAERNGKPREPKE